MIVILFGVYNFIHTTYLCFDILVKMARLVAIFEAMQEEKIERRRNRRQMRSRFLETSIPDFEFVNKYRLSRDQWPWRTFEQQQQLFSIDISCLPIPTIYIRICIIILLYVLNDK